ncbi:hypothetical protein NDU88_002479 [Pleurodeles waltl]|uniref:Uncharacterized protein n=1 Tax=Pleurodeles waltl TaxID=8319 RepID=A0AAV7W2I1_PLEWA|nr:hypothetical protein NDU88_002479 [Pleurodeles waltl]
MVTASHWTEDRARGDATVGEYRRPLRRPEVVRREGTDPAARGPSLPVVTLGAERQRTRGPAAPTDAENGIDLGTKHVD